MRLIACKAGALPEGRPAWLHLVPFGEWRGHHSRKVVKVGPAEAATIVANFTRWGIDLVVDYEHQTLTTVENGQPAPAMGWVDQLEARADGVWGHVKEWTAAGGELLDARAYRYLSPVIEFNAPDPVSGEPRGMRVSSAALTNNPFFAGDLKPVLARNSPGGSVLLSTIIALLGLPTETTEEQAGEAVKSALSMNKDGAPAVDPKLEARAALGDIVCRELGWDKKIPADAPVKLAATLKHDGFVDEAAHLTLQGELEKAKADTIVAKAGDGVERLAMRGIESGKITPAMKPNFVAMAHRDLAGATTWLDTAPVIVPLGTQTSGANAKVVAKAKDTELSPTEQAACTALGIDAATYIKGRK